MKRILKINILFTLLVITIFTACSQLNSSDLVKSKITNSSGAVHLSSNVTESQYVNFISSIPGEDLDSWIGTYRFYEYGGNYINMNYRIFIFKENQQYFADIFIDGHMTMVRDRAEVTGNAESIKLTFIKKYPDGDDQRYQIGDLLISFRYQDSTLYTDWGEFESMLLENNDSGVYFEKVSDELVPQED